MEKTLYGWWMTAGERINKMQGFLLSIRVVTPILLMLCVGMLVRRLGWVDEKTLNVMDRLGFKLLLPTQLFYSLYRAEWDISVYGKPLLASIVIILIILVLALLIFGRLEPDPKRRGPVIQCEIRVNFVIFGMAIIASLYGSENTGLIAIMAAIIIPLTSTISAILFEVYRGGRVKPAMLLLNIIKTPTSSARRWGSSSCCCAFRCPSLWKNGQRYRRHGHPLLPYCAGRQHPPFPLRRLRPFSVAGGAG